MAYKTTCVSACPSSSDPILWKSDCNLDKNINVSVCNQTALTCGNMLLKDTDPTIFCLYATNVFLDRICFPANLSAVASSGADSFNSFVNNAKLSSWFEALKKTWVVILIAFFIALVISFIFLIITKYFVGVIIWLFIILYLVFLAVLGGVVY